MSRFLQQLIAAPHDLWNPGPAEAKIRPRVLIITADLSFYCCILNAACSFGWTAEWAPTMNRGLELCGSRLISIVIYDRNLPNVDWRCALDRLSTVAHRARVLLAAPEIDEDLWRMVLRRRGYDVLARSAKSEQLRRELRFAWLSLREFRETVVTAALPEGQAPSLKNGLAKETK